MHLDAEPNGKLVAISTSQFFDRVLLLAAGLCTVPTIRGAWHGWFDLHESTPLIGSALFLFGFVMVYERSRFEFDPTVRLVR